MPCGGEMARIITAKKVKGSFLCWHEVDIHEIVALNLLLDDRYNIGLDDYDKIALCF